MTSLRLNCLKTQQAQVGALHGVRGKDRAFEECCFETDCEGAVAVRNAATAHAAVGLWAS